MVPSLMIQAPKTIGVPSTWVAIAATCVTSSMFLSALAPNLLATALVKSQIDISISWGTWALAFLPVGVILLLLTPLLAYWFYPPTIKSNAEVPRWAAAELTKLGPMQLKEWLLVKIVCLALVLWIFAAKVYRTRSRRLISYLFNAVHQGIGLVRYYWQ
ncbi:hypothetical protein ALON55S_01922 [Alishewanella longhuensis]